ncbi:MAG TPA: hypothetical protein VJB35_01080 [Candidatus Nanoarchaeia archaeon]|nr:hypothetical protein [Candidatus Nanoarchaeia archaeon]
MKCSNCDGKNLDISIEINCPRCKGILCKRINSSWFYCLNKNCEVNAVRFNLICPKYKIRCLGCYEMTKKPH